VTHFQTQWQSLRQFEREIAALAAWGWTSEQIARMRHNASGIYIRQRLKAIYEELGVESRLQLAVMFQEHIVNALTENNK